MISSQQQDALIALIRRKGYRVRGRGGFLDRLGVGDAMTLDLLSDESYAWAIEYLTARPDVQRRGEPLRCGADDIGKVPEGEVLMSDPFKVKASSGGGDYESCPAGTFPAILLGLLDIGTYSESFQGQPPKDQRKALLVWEVHVEDARHYVCRDYTLSFNSKAGLRQLVEKWRGKTFGDDEAFDLTAMAGKPCLISIVHKQSQAGNTYARVDGVMQLPKGMPVPSSPHKPCVWSVTSGTPVPVVEWIPYLRGEPLADTVKRCKERNGGVSAPVAEPEPAGVDGPANAVPF